MIHIKEALGRLGKGMAYVATHKGQATVGAEVNLRLVDIDEYSWMSQGSTSAITGYLPIVCPSYWLFVNELDGCIGLWLPPVSLKSSVVHCMVHAHLKVHYSLFKPRATHCFASRLLACGPCSCSIRSLHLSLLLSDLWQLVQRRISSSYCTAS